MRLQKYLSRSGVASRRSSEDLIVNGKVKVNEMVVDTLGYRVDPDKDRVKVNDKLIMIPQGKVYLLFNKPRGVVTTMNDPRGRKTVADYFNNFPTRIYPVGRLDMDTEGLLLLTNDGELANRLMHPRYESEKHYTAVVKGYLNDEKLIPLRNGITLKEGKTVPAKVNIIKRSKDKTVLSITLREGKNRQIRRMMQAVGHPVIKLKREGISFLSSKGINNGEYRLLKVSEVRKLKKELNLI